MSKTIDVDGLNEIENENTQIEDLETEDVNLMFVAIDTSGSMTQYIDPMKKELEAFKASIINSKEADKILVARADFSDYIKYIGYKKIHEFNTDYQTENSTRLHDVIVEGAQKLKQYMTYLKQQGMRVKAVFAIFSDGQDNGSQNDLVNALRTIQELNKLEVVTAFIAFGNDGLQEAHDLDIKNILEMGKTEHDLRKAFNTLSKSLISQSKSVVPKKNDFFEM